VKSPKYWLASAPRGEVVFDSTKARPKPGLEEISGKIENTKEVEKEEMVEELELFGVDLIMVSLVG